LDWFDEPKSDEFVRILTDLVMEADRDGQ